MRVIAVVVGKDYQLKQGDPLRGTGDGKVRVAAKHEDHGVVDVNCFIPLYGVPVMARFVPDSPTETLDTLRTFSIHPERLEESKA